MKNMVIISSMIITGCSSDYLSSHSPSNWDYKVSSDVLEAWDKYHSYYALSEIIDTYINPWCNPATKQQVRHWLGQGDEGQYGHTGGGPDCWIYTSHRKVPYGSYCIIEFGKDGKVSNISWKDE